MDLVFYQIGLSSVYQPYLVTFKCIPGDYLMKLVERMPRVYKAVIKANGGYLKNLYLYYVFLFV